MLGNRTVLFRARFAARHFSPLWTDLLQSFTPSVACIPKLRFLRGHHCAVLLNRLTPHIRRRNGSLSMLTLQRGTLAYRSRPRKVPSSKSAVIRRGRYLISPKRGWARCNRNLIHKKLLFHFDFYKAEKLTTLVARNRASRAT